MSQLEREAVARTILEVAALYSRWVGRLAEADVTVDLFFMAVPTQLSNQEVFELVRRKCIALRRRYQLWSTPW